MKTVQLEASLRENTGKAQAKKIREQGKVPAIMYGGEKEIHVVVDKKALDKIVFTPERYFIELNIDGEKHNTIIQEHQFHPVTDHIVHIDFLEFSGNEPIVMNIPIRTHGIAPGVQAGGNLFSKMRYVLIRALPKDMPERIEIDISSLQINMAVHISDLPQENREYLAAPEATVVAVIAARDAMLDEDLVEEEEEEEGEEGEGAEEGATEENAGGEE
ncbi:MAG: 50S ribosomal protein L25 [Bacteroidales bacterium]|nr:50S ribosomal protein L25 [Bacteroidales bacterium]MCF8328136.1 50S ribosomal protein L25 [Bacteroidales bacterium]